MPCLAKRGYILIGLCQVVTIPRLHGTARFISTCEGAAVLRAASSGLDRKDVSLPLVLIHTLLEEGGFKEKNEKIKHNVHLAMWPRLLENIPIQRVGLSPICALIRC